MPFLIFRRVGNLSFFFFRRRTRNDVAGFPHHGEKEPDLYSLIDSALPGSFRRTVWYASTVVSSISTSNLSRRGGPDHVPDLRIQPTVTPRKTQPVICEIIPRPHPANCRTRFSRLV